MLPLHHCPKNGDLKQLLAPEYPIALRSRIKDTQSYIFCLYWEKEISPPQTSVEFVINVECALLNMSGVGIV